MKGRIVNGTEWRVSEDITSLMNEVIMRLFRGHGIRVRVRYGHARKVKGGTIEGRLDGVVNVVGDLTVVDVVWRIVVQKRRIVDATERERPGRRWAIEFGPNVPDGIANLWVVRLDISLLVPHVVLDFHQSVMVQDLVAKWIRVLAMHLFVIWFFVFCRYFSTHRLQLANEAGISLMYVSSMTNKNAFTGR